MVDPMVDPSLGSMFDRRTLMNPQGPPHPQPYRKMPEDFQGDSITGFHLSSSPNLYGGPHLEKHQPNSPCSKAAFIPSEVLMASAEIVKAGFAAPTVTKTLPSPTNKFGTS